MIIVIFPLKSTLLHFWVKKEGKWERQKSFDWKTSKLLKEEKTLIFLRTILRTGVELESVNKQIQKKGKRNIISILAHAAKILTIGLCSYTNPFWARLRQGVILLFWTGLVMNIVFTLRKPRESLNEKVFSAVLSKGNQTSILSIVVVVVFLLHPSVSCC